MKICCPTDFSDHSILAVKYAMHLALATNSSLHLIAAYEVPRKAASFIQLKDIIREHNENDMATLIDQIKIESNGELEIFSEVRNSMAVNFILKYSQEQDIDLVIMGTQGNNSMRTLVFGSTTKKVSQRSKIPVLAVPQDIATHLTSNKLVMAIDDKGILDGNIFQVPRKIAKRLNLKIDLLHIQNEVKEEFPFDPFITEYLDQVLGEVIIEKAKDPVKAIKEYVEKTNVGMLIMLRRPKSFFQRLFIKGNTAAEIVMTNIPLLILPDHEN